MARGRKNTANDENHGRTCGSAGCSWLVPTTLIVIVGSIGVIIYLDSQILRTHRLQADLASLSIPTIGSSDSNAIICANVTTTTTITTPVVIAAVAVEPHPSNPKILQWWREHGKSSPGLIRGSAALSAQDASSSFSLTADSHKDPCISVLRQFHALNDCYRAPFYHGAALPHNDTVPPPLPAACAQTPTGYPVPPLYNYAFYAGQGMGRVVEHTVAHCIVAFHLSRPCVVGLRGRDQSYVWRSFIGHGNYNWDSALVDLVHYPNISRAIAAMEGQGRGGWKPDAVPTSPDVFAMQPLESGSPDQLQRAIDFWGANASVPGAPVDQILLSPNWGDAWFMKFPIHPIQQCSGNDLSTLIQNEMYAPTDISRQLHQERRDKILPKATANGQPYGAMHLRTYFWFEGKSTEQDIAIAVMNCMDQYPDISTWWVTTDEPMVLFNLTNVTLPGMLEAPYVAKVVHGYDAAFLASNEHTASANARLYNHERMAPGIMDWMVLHEATLALIGDGAYAASGARGRGKIKSGNCGTNGAHKPGAKPVLMNIYAPRQAAASA
jgi:hypothetical protein